MFLFPLIYFCKQDVSEVLIDTAKEEYEIKTDKTALRTLSTNLFKEELGFCKEILINALDSLTKLRIKSENPDIVFGKDITIEREGEYLSFQDQGIGMSKKDLIEYMGRLGGSGSRDNADCIGTFGIGFYTVFRVADEVTVVTKAYDTDKAHKLVFGSETNKFTIEETEMEGEHGCIIKMKLRDDVKIEDEKLIEYLNSSLLQSELTSNFSINFVSNGETKKIDLMPWVQFSCKEEYDKEFERVFKKKPTLHHAEAFNFDIIQKTRTGGSHQASFEAVVFFPEVFDMRILGADNEKGQVSFFLYNMKMHVEHQPEFLNPFYIIVRSQNAKVISTREEFINGKVDNDAVYAALTRKIVEIINGLVVKEEISEKVIKSYNGYLKSGALEFHKKNEKEISKKILEACAFEMNDAGFTPISRMTGDILHYTEMSSILAKMRNGVVNPNFDNINLSFFFVTGMLDQQVVSTFKDTKSFKNLISKDFGDKERIESFEFKDWAKRALTGICSEVRVSNRLDQTPFAIRVKDIGISSSYKAMIGENAINSSIFKATFQQYPLLEYNPDHPVFVKLMEVKRKDESLATSLLRAYVAACGVVSGYDLDDKVGGYISITNVCNNILGLDMTYDYVEPEKDKWDDDKKWDKSTEANDHSDHEHEDDEIKPEDEVNEEGEVKEEVPVTEEVPVEEEAIPVTEEVPVQEEVPVEVREEL